MTIETLRNFNGGQCQIHKHVMSILISSIRCIRKIPNKENHIWWYCLIQYHLTYLSLIMMFTYSDYDFHQQETHICPIPSSSKHNFLGPLKTKSKRARATGPEVPTVWRKCCTCSLERSNPTDPDRCEKNAKHANKNMEMEMSLCNVTIYSFHSSV